MAATSPEGLAVRDAYRHIKALPRRAKELGRNVAGYTTDLYCQLEKMGQGTVQRCGRVVRFVAGVGNAPTTPEGDGVDAVTVVTVAESQEKQESLMSPLNQVSPVTDQDFGRVDTDTGEIDVLDLSTQVNSATASEDSALSPEFIYEESATTTEPSGERDELLTDAQTRAFFEQMHSCQTLDQVMDFRAALDALSPQQRNQFESSVPEDTWTWLWNLPVAQEQEQEPELVSEQEQEPELVSEPVAVSELVSEPVAVSEPELVSEPESELVSEPEQELVSEPESELLSEPPPEPTLEELKALLLACDSLVHLNEIKRKHSKTVAIAYDSMSEEEQAHIDGLAALAVPHKVFKYMGDEIRQGTQRLIKGTLVYLDPAAFVKPTAYDAPVWSINGVASGWFSPINVSLSLLLEVVKAVLPDELGGSQQMGLI